MFALIYDPHDMSKPFKQVLSVHKTREAAQQALEKRMARSGKHLWERDARIVWLTENAKPGYGVTENAFSTRQPGESIPYGQTQAERD